MEYRCVARLNEIPEGELLGIEVDGERVVLANVEGEVFALEGICTHAYALLDEGDLDGHNLVCPDHFAEFDVRTGEVTAPPADRSAKTFPVRIENGEIQIGIADRAGHE